MSRHSYLLATTIFAVIGTVATADHASARGGGGFHASGGASHFGGVVHAPVRVGGPGGPTYRAGSRPILMSTVRSGTIKFPPVVSPAAMGAPTIKLSQIPASPNAPANLGNAPKSTGLIIPQSPAPNAPANPGNAGSVPKPTGPVVTIPQSPASPTAPGKVLLPANPAHPGAGGATPGGTPAPAPMRRTDVSFGPIPLGIGTNVVVEDTCYWIKAKLVSQDGPVVRLVKVCDTTDASQP